MNQMLNIKLDKIVEIVTKSISNAEIKNKIAQRMNVLSDALTSGDSCFIVDEISQLDYLIRTFIITKKDILNIENTCLEILIELKELKQQSLLVSPINKEDYTRLIENQIRRAYSEGKNSPGMEIALIYKLINGYNEKEIMISKYLSVDSPQCADLCETLQYWAQTQINEPEPYQTVPKK